MPVVLLASLLLLIFSKVLPRYLASTRARERYSTLMYRRLLMCFSNVAAFRSLARTLRPLDLSPHFLRRRSHRTPCCHSLAYISSAHFRWQSMLLFGTCLRGTFNRKMLSRSRAQSYWAILLCLCTRVTPSQTLSVLHAITRLRTPFVLAWSTK